MIHSNYFLRIFSLLCCVIKSRRPLSTSKNTKAPFFSLGSEWNETSSGTISAVDIVPGIVAIGTDSGGLHVFSYDDKRCVLRPYLSVPPPPSNDMSITMCKISAGKKKVSIFVAYHRQKRAVRGLEPLFFADGMQQIY